jgi:hypothetical protein
MSYWGEANLRYQGAAVDVEHGIQDITYILIFLHAIEVGRSVSVMLNGIERSHML